MTNDIMKALDLIGDYEQVQDAWLNSLLEPHTSPHPYIVFTQVERAYEQLQTLGVDVSDKLKKTRTIIVRSLYDMISAEINHTGQPEEGSLEGIELSIPYLKRAVNLLEEYIRKADSKHPSLTGDLMSLEITPGEEERK
jgi:hypothetical protein